MGKIESNSRAILDLDRTIHEPARLAILTVLASAEEEAFPFLQRVTGLSKGNLSSHTQKLEAVCYLETLKVFQERIPVTRSRISDDGRSAFHRFPPRLRALWPQEA